MSKLIRLPNGAWIEEPHLRDITSLEVFEGFYSEASAVRHAPRVALQMRDGRRYIINFDSELDAQAWADQFAAQVNGVRS
jgi:hypothetical protein